MDVKGLSGDCLKRLYWHIHAALYYEKPKNYKHRYRLSMIHSRITLEETRRLKEFMNA